jgi:hypothetical protein
MIQDFVLQVNIAIQAPFCKGHEPIGAEIEKPYEIRFQVELRKPGATRHAASAWHLHNAKNDLVYVFY